MYPTKKAAEKQENDRKQLKFVTDILTGHLCRVMQRLSTGRRNGGEKESFLEKDE